MSGSYQLLLRTMRPSPTRELCTTTALRFLTISPSSLSRFPGDPAPTLAITNAAAPAQFRPLLVLGQGIALLGRGKAALAGDTELIEGRIFRRLVDAALELVLAFEPAALGGHDAEHHGLALGQHAQGLEAAGALVVILHEVAVHVDLVEQDFLHRLVAAGAHEGRFIVAAAQMHRDRHVGRNVG